jgi:hypothetical protein
LSETTEKANSMISTLRDVFSDRLVNNRSTLFETLSIKININKNNADDLVKFNSDALNKLGIFVPSACDLLSSKYGEECKSTTVVQQVSFIIIKLFILIYLKN